MSRKSVAQAPLAGPGTHTATLGSITDTESFGRAAYRFEFPTLDGNVAVVTTGVDVRKGTRLGDLVEGMIGRPLKVGEPIDLDDFVGKRFDVTCVPAPRGENGGAVVQKVSPVV